MKDLSKTFLVYVLGLFSCMLCFTLLTSFTGTEPPVYSIQKLSSYDGITVYRYTDYVIVKTENSVSITR